MASEGSSDFDELSEYSYDSAGSGATASIDTVDELLQRFTLDCHPDCTVKLRYGLGPVVLGADLTYSTADYSKSGSIVVKPSNQSVWWRRLRVDHTGTFTLRSRKLQWWVFTLDLHGHANPAKRTTDVSFRLATKWDISSGEIRKKKLFPMGEGAEGRVHWSVNYNMPTIEGSLGTQQARDINADLGYAHFSIPKAELVVWPRKLLSSPEEAADFGAAGGSGEEQEGGSSNNSSSATAGAKPCCGSSQKGGAAVGDVAALAALQRGGHGGHGAPLAAMGVALRQHLPWRDQPQGSCMGVGSRRSVGLAMRLAPGDLRAHIFQLAHGLRDGA